MNFGKSVKKLASEFNVVLNLYKSTGVCKTNSTSKALGELKCNEIFRIPYSAPISNINPTGLDLPWKEKFDSLIKNDIPMQKKIEEPGKVIKIKIKLPVGVKKVLDLPCSVEKEIKEPITKIISKKAKTLRRSVKEIEGMHIISIRKRKMRIHKRKKYEKKHRVELMKKRADRKFQKEYDFQMKLKEIIKQYESFSPEEYLNKTLEALHWEKPVTKVRGILAPKWVIKEYLQKQEENKMLQKRLDECINSRK